MEKEKVIKFIGAKSCVKIGGEKIMPGQTLGLDGADADLIVAPDVLQYLEKRADFEAVELMGEDNGY